MDKARSRLKAVGVGEETVRIVDYDEEVARPAPKAPRPVARADESVWEEPEDTSTTVFEVDPHEDYFASQQERYDEAMKRYDDVPELRVDPESGKISDVLQVLEIPETFELDHTVLAPEDFEDIVFDQQIPQGYDMGQVNIFLTRAAKSVARYYELLELRNAHVAQLATVVDKLQFDAREQQYQTEIAHGINIMPTHSNDGFEVKLLEARVRIRALEDQLKAAGGEQAPEVSDAFMARHMELKDQYSVLSRNYEDLEQRHKDLLLQKAYEEEMAEAPVERSHANEDFHHENLVSELPTFDTSALSSPGAPAPLTTSAFATELEDDTAGYLSAEASESVAFELADEPPYAPIPPEAIEQEEDSSSFLLDTDESLAGYKVPQPASAAPSYVTYSEDDDEDELDALMKDWNK
jgi:hypothetical protein